MKINTEKNNLGWILAVYLAGIFMGAIDTGIVTPAREIIQNGFGVSNAAGIWMITIYTLAYAASIPVMGKLGDRIGRRTIYILSIFLFGLGSLFCGLSRYTDIFGFLVGARALQAVGGGGIMPIATAEFGTSFPKEKRGMALGLVGAVYGIANIFGSLAGSAILDLFGTQEWQFIFFVNLPITLFIIVAGLVFLPNNRESDSKPIDFTGILIITAMVLSLLYGLRNIDFFHFRDTIGSTSVYPFLIAAALLLPIFIAVEKRAGDPVINLHYFTSSPILISLLVAFAAGFILMGIVFIPQFSENALKLPSGNGGYFTVILGFLAGISAGISGRLIDKMGPKKVLMLGFAVTLTGVVFLILTAASSPGLWNVVASLMLLGFGLGFTMGAPVNYMMLENIPDREAGSGLATLSLIRSIGTTIAPALMVGFIAHAGLSLQPNLTAELPLEVSVPPLPYVNEITDEIDLLKKNPAVAEMLRGIELPDSFAMTTIPVDFSGSGNGTALPEDLVQAMRRSDVTTITGVMQSFASYFFDRFVPEAASNVQNGVQKGIDGVDSGILGLAGAISQMSEAAGQAGPGGAAMQPAIDQMKDTETQLSVLRMQMNTLRAAVPVVFDKARENYLNEIEARGPVLESVYQSTLNEGYRGIYLLVGVLSVLAMLLLIFYRKEDSSSAEESES